MKKKYIILTVIIVVIGIGTLSLRYICHKNEDVISSMISIQLPSKSKYITKDIHSDNSQNENIDYYVIEILLDNTIEFKTAIRENHWKEYVETNYDLYFNNWVGKILKKKIPLLGISGGWLILFDSNHMEIDIKNCSEETLDSFVFAMYDWNSHYLYVLKWMNKISN